MVGQDDHMTRYTMYVVESGSYISLWYSTNLSDFHKRFESVSRKPVISSITIKSPSPRFESQSELLDSVQFYIKILYDGPTYSALELVFVN